MEEIRVGSETRRVIEDLLAECDRLLDQLGESLEAIDRSMGSLPVTTSGAASEALDLVSQIRNLAAQLRTFESQAEAPSSIQMYRLLSHARRLVSDGSNAWEKIGDDLLKIAADVYTEARSGAPNPQFPISFERFSGDWVREPFTLNAFNAMLRLPESPEKWLFFLRYLSDLTLSEIADLAGVTAPAMNMRMNRMVTTLSVEVVKLSIRDIARLYNPAMDITFGEPEDVIPGVRADLEMDLGFEYKIRMAIISSERRTGRQNTVTWDGNIQRFIERSMPGQTRTYIPAICVYDRREAELFMFAGERSAAAMSSLKDTGKWGQVLPDESLLPSLHRQIFNVISERTDL